MDRTNHGARYGYGYRDIHCRACFPPSHAGVRRVTFMIVDPERYPRFYTYRQRLGWKEVM
jgi:hypothetical protein